MSAVNTTKENSVHSPISNPTVLKIPPDSALNKADVNAPNTKQESIPQSPPLNAQDVNTKKTSKKCNRKKILIGISIFGFIIMILLILSFINLSSDDSAAKKNTSTTLRRLKS